MWLPCDIQIKKSGRGAVTTTQLCSKTLQRCNCEWLPPFLPFQLYFICKMPSNLRVSNYHQICWACLLRCLCSLAQKTPLDCLQVADHCSFWIHLNMFTINSQIQRCSLVFEHLGWIITMVSHNTNYKFLFAEFHFISII